MTDDEDGVADVAVHVAELLVVGGRLLLHRRRKLQCRTEVLCRHLLLLLGECWSERAGGGSP